MFCLSCFLSHRGVRDDIEQEDELESYMRFMEENPHIGLNADDEEEAYEYDADGNIIGTEKKVSAFFFYFFNLSMNFLTAVGFDGLKESIEQLFDSR